MDRLPTPYCETFTFVRSPDDEGAACNGQSFPWIRTEPNVENLSPIGQSKTSHRSDNLYIIRKMLALDDALSGQGANVVLKHIHLLGRTYVCCLRWMMLSVDKE